MGLLKLIPIQILKRIISITDMAADTVHFWAGMENRHFVCGFCTNITMQIEYLTLLNIGFIALSTNSINKH